MLCSCCRGYHATSRRGWRWSRNSRSRARRPRERLNHHGRRLVRRQLFVLLPMPKLLQGCHVGAIGFCKAIVWSHKSRMAATLAATTRSARPSQTASFQLATHACCGSDRMSVLGSFACAPRSRRSSTTAGLDSATPLAQPRHALYSRVRFRSSFRSKSSSLVFRMDNTSSKRASKTAAKSDLCTRSRSRTCAGRFDRVGKIGAERTPKWPSSAQLQRFNPFGQHIAAQASEYYADGWPRLGCSAHRLF